MQTPKLYIITALFLICGPLFAYAGVTDYLDHRALVSNGEEVVAKVVDIDTKYLRRQGTVYEVTARYPTDSGDHENTFRVSEDEFAIALVSQEIPVRYSASDPSYAKIASEAPSAWAPLTGLGMFGFGIFGSRKLAAQRRRKATQDISASGTDTA